MGWLIFIAYLFCGSMFHLFDKVEETLEPGSKGRKIARVIKIGAISIIGLGLVILILYIIGLIWYFFCCGFLIFEDQPFWDKVVCGLMSVVFLGFILGFIAICFGWDPNGRR